MKEFQGIDPTQVIEEFLLDVWEYIPAGTDSIANALQRFLSDFESIVHRLEEQHAREGRTIKRMSNKLAYLRTIAISASGIATRATVIEPLVRHLRELLRESQDDNSGEA